MGKAARKKKTSEKETGPVIQSRSGPNWALFGLALIGMGLTAYLTLSAWSGQAVAGCTAGSGCDLVLNSRWSKLFGLPTSLWGFLAYGGLAGIAFIKRADTHWKLAWSVSLFGVLYSLYLTGVSIFELEAACPYCLTSLALMSAALGTVAFQRPAEMAKFSWPSWLIWTASGALVLVLFLHFQYAGTQEQMAGVEDPRARALAEHLTKTGAKFYGTYWCPHCKEQKELFGASAQRLPYIECSPAGRSGPQAAACRAAGVQVYPTWVINGERFEGVLFLEDLIRISGFRETS